MALRNSQGTPRSRSVPPKQSSKCWAVLEARVEDLVQKIKPSQSSDYRRSCVSNFVKSLIKKCFSQDLEVGLCHVPAFCYLPGAAARSWIRICVALQVEAFMFGSVPLKTYLPDGDIDLAVFQGKGPKLRDTWNAELSAFLETEGRNTFTQFRVKDVQIINAEVNGWTGSPLRAGPLLCPVAEMLLTFLHAPACSMCPHTSFCFLLRCTTFSVCMTFPYFWVCRQVKLLKCLVDNIVVDISYDTIGGLCTVAFLESIDRHIGEKHLFKRSVILVGCSPSITGWPLFSQAGAWVSDMGYVVGHYAMQRGAVYQALHYMTGEGMVLLREQIAWGAPWAAVHVRAGDNGALHLQHVPPRAAVASEGG